MKMWMRVLVVALASALLLGTLAHAARKGKRGQVKCPRAIVTKDTGIFSIAKDFTCFKNKRLAKKAGFIQITDVPLPTPAPTPLPSVEGVWETELQVVSRQCDLIGNPTINVDIRVAEIDDTVIGSVASGGSVAFTGFKTDSFFSIKSGRTITCENFSSPTPVPTGGTSSEQIGAVLYTLWYLNVIADSAHAVLEVRVQCGVFNCTSRWEGTAKRENENDYDNDPDHMGGMNQPTVFDDITALF